MVENSFNVYGPFVVPLIPRSRIINQESLSKFWKKVGAPIASARGCYVFGVRTGRGIMPFYVGKATKRGFEKEAFADHKLAQHYDPVLGIRKRGKPIMFFILEDRAKGRPNAGVVGEVERFLIGMGEIRNPKLSNRQHRDQTEWSIHGVSCNCTGKPPASASAFKRMMSS